MDEHAILHGCNWKIGNGNNLKTFSSAWLQGRTPVAKNNLPLRQIPQPKVSDFIDVENHVWTANLV